LPSTYSNPMNIPLTHFWKYINHQRHYRKTMHLYMMNYHKIYNRDKEKRKTRMRIRYATEPLFRENLLLYRKQSRAKKILNPEYRLHIRQKRNEFIEKNPKVKLRIKIALALSSYFHAIQILEEYGIDANAIYDRIGAKPSKNHHLDHIIPCACFDYSKKEDIARANVPENLRWITKEENRKKGARWEKDGIFYYGNREIGNTHSSSANSST
jgi:hypothetical protein